jgi:thiamine biosynthesis lipoprotein
MRTLPRSLIGLLVTVLASRAAAQVPRHEFTELHLGVATRIVVYADDTTAPVAARAAFGRIAALEDVLSDWRAESEVRRLVAGPRPREIGGGAWRSVSAELFAVLERALEVARATQGAFDPTVGPYVALWREARRTGRLPSDTALADARRRVGWHHVALDTAARVVQLAVPGMRIDLGGIAKGYILGEALAVLRAHGLSSALIEAGGDIVVGDPPPGRTAWTIALGGADTTVATTAVSTSGTGEQFVTMAGVRYAHVVDPRTGLGVTAARTVTVMAADASVADALATALVVLGPERGAGVAARFPGVAVRWWE